MRGEISSLLCLVLAGCQMAPAVPERVLIPVPVKCEVTPPERPTLPIEVLPENATADQTQRALIGTIAELMGYCAALEKTIAPLSPESGGQ